MYKVLDHCPAYIDTQGCIPDHKDHSGSQSETKNPVVSTTGLSKTSPHWKSEIES